MSIRTSPWRPGVPCWVELATSDIASSASFYGHVLGWTVAPPTGQGRSLAAVRDGSTVAGIVPALGGPAAAWTVYLATDDADATASAVTAAGGELLVPPTGPADRTARTALAADPQGAAFGVWQAGTMIGSQLVNEPGGLCWEELRTSDPAAARAFYGGVYGLDFAAEPAAGPEATTFHLPDERVPLGGIRGPDEADAAPPRWLPFFGVTDASAACQAAEDNGGAVLIAEFATPEGRMAQLADPQSADFWVITSTGEDQPDRSG